MSSTADLHAATEAAHVGMQDNGSAADDDAAPRKRRRNEALYAEQASELSDDKSDMTGDMPAANGASMAGPQRDERNEEGSRNGKGSRLAIAGQQLGPKKVKRRRKSSIDGVG